MRYVLYILMVCIVATAGMAMAAVIHVPDEYPTIQDGIDAAQEGDTVLVGPGTYYENIVFRGVNVYLLSESGPETTVIDGEWNDSVFRLTSGEDTTTVVDGFTVTHGWSATDGAGFFLYGAKIKLLNNWIIDNRAERYGGAVNAEAGAVIARYNIFVYNACGYNKGGSGIHTISADLDIYKNLFALNNGPAVIFIRYHSPATIVNNTISNSWSGVSAHAYEPTEAKNNIVTGMVYSAFRAADGGVLINSYNCTHNNLYDYLGCSPGPGAISDDPQYVGGYPFDYHLKKDSPCIDAGDPDSPRDPDGTRADMGAYYFHQKFVELFLTPDATVVEQGGTLGYSVQVVNETDEDQRFGYWSDLFLWNGEPYKYNPVFGPLFGTLKPGESKAGHITHQVPWSAPLETYTLCGRIGDFPGYIWRESCFEFTVAEGTISGPGPGGPDWEVIERTF